MCVSANICLLCMYVYIYIYVYVKVIWYVAYYIRPAAASNGRRRHAHAAMMRRPGYSGLLLPTLNPKP